jgi:signal transduction histidine kinase
MIAHGVRDTASVAKSIVVMNSAGRTVARALNLLVRLSATGAEGDQPLKNRQIVWINQLGLLGAAATSPYVLFYLIYDAGLLPLSIVNLVFIAAYLSIPYLNSVGRPEAARNIGLGTLYIQQFVTTAFLGADAGVHLYYFTLSGVMYFIFSRTGAPRAAALVALAVVLYLVCHFTLDPGLVILPSTVLDTMYVSSVIGAVGLSGVGSYLVRQQIDYSEQALTCRAEELRKTNEALVRSNLDLQQFAYIASHDLQSPLRSIGGFIQILESASADSLNDEAKECIRRTVQAVQRMQTLIRDLLAYSRLDSAASQFQRVNFRDVLADAVALLDAPVRESGAEVTCGTLPIVVGDRSQLVQLLENLIGNALKYRGDEPPRIYVAAEQRCDNWVFSVRDNGIGIDPKYHDRIYDIFRRLHTYQEYSGTGIGLAICRRVVNRHAGRIWVDSELGRGSCFYFTMPTQATNSC